MKTVLTTLVLLGSLSTFAGQTKLDCSIPYGQKHGEIDVKVEAEALGDITVKGCPMSVGYYYGENNSLYAIDQLQIVTVKPVSDLESPCSYKNMYCTVKPR